MHIRDARSNRDEVITYFLSGDEFHTQAECIVLNDLHHFARAK